MHTRSTKKIKRLACDRVQKWILSPFRKANQQLSNGCRSVQKASREMKALLKTQHNVNNLFDAELSQLKFAKVSQRGHKPHASKATAQLLRAQSENNAETDRNSSLPISKNIARQRLTLPVINFQAEMSRKTSAHLPVMFPCRLRTTPTGKFGTTFYLHVFDKRALIERKWLEKTMERCWQPWDWWLCRTTDKSARLPF